MLTGRKRFIPVLALVALLAGGIALVRTTAAPADSWDAGAMKLCAGNGLEAAQRIGGTSVAAAFASTARATIAWASSGRSSSATAPLTTLPGDTSVAFCYIDGDYAVPQPPGSSLTFTRAIYLVPAIGEPIQYAVGNSGNLAILGPAELAP